MVSHASAAMPLFVTSVVAGGGQVSDCRSRADHSFPFFFLCLHQSGTKHRTAAFVTHSLMYQTLPLISDELYVTHAAAFRAENERRRRQRGG